MPRIRLDSYQVKITNQVDSYLPFGQNIPRYLDGGVSTAINLTLMVDGYVEEAFPDRIRQFFEHGDLYRALAEPEVLEAIQNVSVRFENERRLVAATRGI